MVIKTVENESDMKVDVRMKDLFYYDDIRRKIESTMCGDTSCAFREQYDYYPDSDIFESGYHDFIDKMIYKPDEEFIKYLNRLINYNYDVTYLLCRCKFQYLIKLNVIPNTSDTNVLYLPQDVIQKGITNHLDLIFQHKGYNISPK